VIGRDRLFQGIQWNWQMKNWKARDEIMKFSLEWSWFWAKLPEFLFFFIPGAKRKKPIRNSHRDFIPIWNRWQFVSTDLSSPHGFDSNLCL
jgi:hypothetical protein